MNNYHKIFVIPVLTMGLISLFSPVTQAQSSINRQNEPFQSNERNPFYGDGINPMDIIHNANFFNSRTGSDFAEDTENNLNSAAENFKQQQQQRMLEMRQKENNITENEEVNFISN